VSVHPALLVIADGRFPGGAHAHSAGAEWAVRHGDVVDGATMRRFVEGRLATIGAVEAAFAAAACTAAHLGGARTRMDELDAALDARTSSPRVRAVSRRLGRQLARTAAMVAPGGAWADLGTDPHHPIALGVLTAAVGGSELDAATVTLHHLTAAVTSATVRLLALDPAEAAACQLALAPSTAALAARAVAAAVDAPEDLPASSGALAEILSEDHGSWDARLFVG
jgi:urease accessory protein